MINLNPLLREEVGRGSPLGAKLDTKVCSVHRGGAKPIPVPKGLFRMNISSSSWGIPGWFGQSWSSPFRGHGS
jgi:hypothetical protein